MRIPGLLMMALAALLALPGCTSTPATAPEKFTLAGQTVEFSPPPAAWSKSTQEIPKSGELEPTTASPKGPQDLRFHELAGGTMVAFTPSWPDSHITVSALADWPQKSWAEDPEKTKNHIEHLYNQVLKRSNGEVLARKEAKLGGEVAFQMEFRYTDGPREMKGVQIHAIHQGVYWQVALLCPADKYGEALSAFNSLVDSFKFQ